MNATEIAIKQIQNVSYTRVAETTTTICCVETTANGFVIVWKSACIDPSAFDAELGRMYAYEDAVRQLMELYAFTVKYFEEKLSGLVGTVIDEDLFAKVEAALFHEAE